MQKQKRGKKIGWTWSFARMHPVLKTIILLALSVATAGYALTGSWLFYALIKL